MYKPVGLINITKKKYNNTNDNESKNLIPKCLVALFLTLNFVWGFDFGFIKYFDNKFRKTAQFITFLINVFAIAILSSPFCNITKSTYVQWQLMYLLQYIIDFFILNCTKYKLYDFLIDVSVIDFGKLHKSVILNTFCGLIMITYVFGIQLIKYVLIIYITKLEIQELASLLPMPYEIYGIWYFCTDLVPFMLIVIHYYIYLCLKNLCESIHKATVGINKIVEQYTAITECYDKIMPLCDRILMHELLSEVPKLAGLTWWGIYYVINGQRMITAITAYVFAFHIFIRVVIPSIFAEMVNSKMDDIKLILHQKMLEERDDEKNKEIIDFLRYMKARRVHHKCWRVVPVDMQLPITLLNLCVTYIIIAVQLGKIA